MIDKNLFRIDKMKLVLLGLVGLSVLQALFIIGQAYFLSSVISNLWNGVSVSEERASIAYFLIFFLFRQVLIFIRDYSLDRYAYEASRDVRQKLLKKMFKLGPNFVQKQGTGSMVSMSIEGSRQIENYITLIVPKVTNMMVIPFFIIAFIFMQDVRSSIVLVVVFPIIILFMIILGYAARAKADRQYEGYQLLSNHFLDSLRGLETLYTLGLSRSYESTVYEVSEDYRKSTMSTLKVAILSTFALDFFTTLSVAIVALFLGLSLMNGTIALFPALVTLILAPDFFLPLRDFSNDYHATLDGKNTLKQVFTILDYPEPKSESMIQMPQQWSNDDQLSLTHLGVSYSHTKENPVLEAVDFKWKGMGKIGVVGLSGSGKSTLIKLLGGFLESIDHSIEINQQPTNYLGVSDWQKQLFYLPQDPYIFHGTLRDNIRFYVPEATEESCLQAIEQAGLSEVVSELPDGLDTIIGEGGARLSGGQYQRVALARIFLDANRKILLFDEPTAHLDIETESELKQTILPLLDNKFVFFATHRLHWMKEMDYILVLKDGKIVEQGTYHDLTQSNGEYRRLINQMKGDS